MWLWIQSCYLIPSSYETEVIANLESIWNQLGRQNLFPDSFIMVADNLIMTINESKYFETYDKNVEYLS